MSNPMEHNAAEGASYVLDACSLIALIRREAGSDRVAMLLHQAEKGTVHLFVHRVTLAEVYYDVLRSSGKEKADAALAALEALQIAVSYDLDITFIQTLSKYKVAHKISFADAFVLALAETQNATVVTSDRHEFGPIEENGILSFLWIR